MANVHLLHPKAKTHKTSEDATTSNHLESNDVALLSGVSEASV